MNLKVVSGNPTQAAGQVLFLPVFDHHLSGADAFPWSEVDQAVGGLLKTCAAEESFKGKAEQAFAFQTHGRLKPSRVVLLGLGGEARYGPEALRQAAGRAAKWAQKLKVTDVAFALLPSASAETDVRAAVEGFELGAYRFDRYRTVGKDERPAPLRQLTIVASPGAEAKRLQAEAVEGQRVALATNWARDLVNESPGVMTPSRLASEARAAAEETGLKISVGGLKEIRQLKMGMFLGVAQGSAQEPQLIHVWYVPKRADAAKRPPLALVGKAITFDSGGLSLKPADAMVNMKSDMAGSAAVLGAMKVIGALKPPFPVHAFIGACENMPSGTAYRPDDILVSRSGKTVEINNTDAEGRLVLGDILTWASEHKPTALIDLATLTGACIIALGHYTAGAFGENDALMDEVLGAARASGEPLWRLPMSDLQRESLRSEVADMKNTGERYGGAITAAMFLREFVGEVPWVHLDIAGPSLSPKERGYHLKGATGFGVRTLVEWVRQRAQGQG
ncbi:MAG TPA: leucyl aminopeptidase [Myxococcaceae bacterium]|nr:leucyl aminopeptidase [Myxococcaceae bacterium]